MMEGPLTAITFCQRTHNDMTSWSPNVEEEREALTEKVRILITDIMLHFTLPQP